ncbi:hypothetical protein R3W88_013511 [Solanum pinnatisectum]|uniref:Uncharacterized protein n=1 Tax=Solanum pinnatisectum TaxID=50273 RepID=A0AAV9KPV0_9SOLN|nr:hypothetical protein R3W88_013511 [Solanum pinnatisectum]
MKAAFFSSSSGSRMARKSIFLAYLIFFTFSSMASTQTRKFPIQQSTKKHDQEDHLHSSVLCYQLQRIHYRPPFPPPPSPPSSSSSSSMDEIDPRYGVEKRLIPSGPNPLHN